jgi:cytochrome c
MSAKSLFACCLAAAVIPAFAQDKPPETPPAKPDAKAAQALSETHFCSGCHQVDAKVVGPGWKEIAAKYKTEKDAIAKLTEKVKKGSEGVWGKIPMPANAAIKDEETRQILVWVMSL